jgi:hypothetical protein
MRRPPVPLDALLQAGFAREDIDILDGEVGRSGYPEGIEHGFLAHTST